MLLIAKKDRQRLADRQAARINEREQKKLHKGGLPRAVKIKSALRGVLADCRAAPAVI